jgi:hypothetical protein
VKIHYCKQGDEEWHELRSRNFTASNLGEWALEPVKITLTVDQIKAELASHEIPAPSKAKRDDLIALLPNPEQYMELTTGARTAILGKLKQERMLAMKSRPTLTQEEIFYAEREDEMAAQSERKFANNIPVKYGNLLEPFAREYYERVTGFEVAQVGFVEYEEGAGFGCSPDGLIYDRAENPNRTGKHHGLEIKCPIPETHLAWLLDGGLPEEHRLQVHMNMVCTQLDEWHFLSYCPGDAPLLVTVHRDETTERLESGMKILVQEKAKIKAQLGMLWRNAYQKP